MPVDLGIKIYLIYFPFYPIKKRNNKKKLRIKDDFFFFIENFLFK